MLTNVGVSVLLTVDSGLGRKRPFASILSQMKRLKNFLGDGRIALSAVRYYGSGKYD